MKFARLIAAPLALALASCTTAPVRDAPVLIAIDTHVDIPHDYMRVPRFDAGGDSALQVDLGKMRRGGLDAAFFVVYVGQGPLTADGYAEAVAKAERKYSAIERLLARNPQRIRLARTPAELRAHHAQGLLGAAIGIENGYSLGHDLGRLDAAYARGARYLGLVHAGNNDLCSSSAPNVERGEPAHNSAGDAGMSAFGRAAVARANALGLMVDVSHASDACVRDALAVSKTPLLASHSSARAVTDHPRNLPDELLRAIAAAGGALPAMVEGMARIQQVHPLADLDDYMAHVRHMVRVAGIDHVGLTSDFDGGGGITGWMDASQTGNVTAALRAAGFSERDIPKLWGGNLLRVWQAAIDHAAQARGASR